MNGSSQFCFHRDHSRMSKRHQEPALVFRELKPKCCFVLTRFQVFEVQGTEFWKPQAALGFGSSHTDSEEQCLEKCECPLCLGTVLSACPWRPLEITKGPRKLTPDAEIARPKISRDFGPFLSSWPARFRWNISETEI